MCFLLSELLLLPSLTCASSFLVSLDFTSRRFFLSWGSVWLLWGSLLPSQAPGTQGKCRHPSQVPGAAQVMQEELLGAQGRGFRLSQALAPPCLPSCRVISCTSHDCWGLSPPVCCLSWLYILSAHFWSCPHCPVYAENLVYLADSRLPCHFAGLKSSSAVKCVHAVSMLPC